MSEGRALRDARQALEAAGLDGWFLVRDLRTGAEIGIDPQTSVPAASLVKLPLALAVLDHARTGVLEPTEVLRFAPDPSAVPGPVGLGRFRHPASVSVEDAVYLAVALSDNTAADALLGLVPPAEVNRWLVDHGVQGTTLRHGIGELSDTPVEAMPDDPRMALTLAARGGTAGHGHPVRQLDVGRTSATTAASLVDLLQLVWDPGDRLDAGVAAHVRDLLGANVHRQRLWPDFASDDATWSSKTGTVLNLRHEAGVVAHADGATFAVVVLTASRVPASVQPAAEAAAGHVARLLHDELRRR